MKLTVVILAAGKGTRMRSARPKVLHEAAGRSLIDLVIDQAEEIVKPESIIVVIGHGVRALRRHLEKRNAGIRAVIQEPQLGTGDALRVATEQLQPSEDEAFLVLSGDVPLLRSESLRRLLAAIEGGAEAALLTAILPQPGEYGRILRNPAGGVEAIIEARDADEETLAVQEVNAGVYIFRASSLIPALAGLKPENAQGEYYLTDVIARLRRQDLPVKAVLLEEEVEMLGVNTRAGLARVSQILVDWEMKDLMDSGVSIICPRNTWIEPGSHIEPEVVIEPGVVVRGQSRIASGARIGAFSLVDGGDVGPGERLPPHSVRGKYPT